jgi:diguanylate cyclase (GGDEF)-like protein
MESVTREECIQADLVKLLYQQLQYVLWIESVVAICFAYTIFDRIDHIILVSWLIANLFLCGVMRHILLYHFRKSGIRGGVLNKKPKYWLAWFCLGTFVSGMIWGLVGIIFIPLLTGSYQILAIMLLMGAVAAANPICAPSRISYICYLLPAYLPFVIWQLTQDDNFFSMGILGFFYIAIMLLISYYTNKILINTFSLRYDNAGLINDLSKKNEEVEESLALTRATIQSMKDGVLVVDEAGEIRDFNSKFISMWQIPETVSKKKCTRAILAICQDQLINPISFVKMFRAVSRSPELETFDELHLKNGHVFERYSRLQRVGERCVGHVWTFSDVTDKKKIENRLLIQANHDSLTGLPNRAMLIDRINQSIKQSKRNKSFLAVMFLDLDRFKLINDTLGHILGDKFLKVVAERLQACVREKDTVTRNGGDEFIILLSELHDESDVLNISLKCINAISEPFVIEGNKFSLTTSIGISVYPRDGQSSDLLIRHADIAMYQAKELGRNNFQFFTSEMNNQVRRRMQIESKLQQVDKDKEFKLHYQPIVSLQTKKMSSVEVSLQWIDSELGEISPTEFTPIADDSALIVEIGDWMLHEICKKVSEWRDQELNPTQLQIKLSARQLKLTDLMERILSIMQYTKTPPHYLALTLTEVMLMDDIDRNIEVIKKIKEFGIAIIIDDFGVGCSNLNYLKRLPVDKLKINQSMIKDVVTNREDRAIYTAIISMAHHLQLTVQAEGVELPEQIEFLVQNSCDELMGSYYSPPLSQDEFVEFMRENVRLEIPKIS